MIKKYLPEHYAQLSKRLKGDFRQLDTYLADDKFEKVIDYVRNYDAHLTALFKIILREYASEYFGTARANDVFIINKIHYKLVIKPSNDNNTQLQIKLCRVHRHPTSNVDVKTVKLPVRNMFRYASVQIEISSELITLKQFFMSIAKTHFSIGYNQFREYIEETVRLLDHHNPLYKYIIQKLKDEGLDELVSKLFLIQSDNLTSRYSINQAMCRNVGKRFKNGHRVEGGYLNQVISLFLPVNKEDSFSNMAINAKGHISFSLDKANYSPMIVEGETTMYEGSQVGAYAIKDGEGTGWTFSYSDKYAGTFIPFFERNKDDFQNYLQEVSNEIVERTNKVLDFFKRLFEYILRKWAEREALGPFIDSL